MKDKTHIQGKGRLTTKKNELLQRLLRQEGPTNAPTHTIPRRAESNLCPISPVQRWLLHDEHEPSTSSQHAQISAWHISGEIDLIILQQSLYEVISRHEILRISLDTTKIEPKLTITDGAVFDWHFTNLEHTHEHMREQELNHLLHEEALYECDLTSKTPLRVHAIALAPEEYVLIFTTHTIVADQHSHRLLAREVSHYYNTIQAGTETPLPDLLLQYPDYAQWQHDRVSEKEQEHVRYWKQQLEHSHASLPFPPVSPRSLTQSNQRGSYTTLITPELLNSIQSFSQQENVSLFTTLLAGMAITLARYCRLEELNLGTTLSQRNYPELNSLIGCFDNTLVVRTYFTGRSDTREILRRVVQTMQDATQHQDLPFGQVHNEVLPSHDDGSSPLFQVMLKMQTPPSSELNLHNTKATAIPTAHLSENADLALVFSEEAHTLTCRISYKQDLFTSEMIERIMASYRLILQGMISETMQSIWYLPLVTEEDKQRIQGWNVTTRVVDVPDITLSELFENWAQRIPETLAVKFNDTSFTYRELSARTSQMAHFLRELGVDADIPVGLCLPCSLDLIVGMFGILKAGGAYVPLDPSYPPDRLAFMLTDTAAPVVLTSQELQSVIPASYTGKIVCVDRDWSTISQYPQFIPEIWTHPDTLAYIIYTSGSTGLPKGVSCPHRGVLNLVADMDARKYLAPGTLCSLWTTINFDASVYEIFSALFAGGTLVLVPEDIRPQTDELFEWLQREHIQAGYLPPFTLEPLVKWLELPQNNLDLQRIMVGVEPFAESLLAKLRACVPDLYIINAYGPTETTVCATLFDMLDSPQERNAPIGFPVQRMQSYILDSSLQLLPIGMPGELYVGGIGVTRGYNQRPDLTAERYIPDPFGSELGGRLYKTGDEVRYLSDGNILFLGRRDQQIKLRGHRIELREIESVLLRHPAVKEAAVSVIEPKGRRVDRQLVGYVVPNAESNQDPLSEDVLQAFLRTQLPEYMVPPIWMFLDAMPKTVNGKLDRRSLPKPTLKKTRAVEDLSILPKNRIERKIATIWQHLLGIDEIGIHDSFFALGGHSLLAAQMQAHVRKTFGIELPMQQVFATPTIASLAEKLQTLQLEKEIEEEIILAPTTRNQTLPLSFAQQRFWFLDRLTSTKSTYTVPFAWRLEGQIDRTALQQSLDVIVARHEVLRTTFVIENDEPQQRIAPAGRIILDIQPWSPDAMQQELTRPFDLTYGPLLRAILYTGDETVLLLHMHHCITDGWSFAILARELSQAYTAISAKKTPALPPLPIQYADYSFWQRRWLASGRGDEQLQYWKQQLANAPILLPLPTDMPRPAIQRHHGTSIPFHLDAELLASLHSLSQQEGVTLFMTLLAGLSIVLARYSRVDEVNIGTPVANRSHAELETLIGCFINTLVLRTDLSGHPSAKEMLRRVATVARAAYDHQDVPFEQVVEAVQPPRDLSYSPLFQVMLALQNAGAISLDLAGVNAHELTLSSQGAMFDLLISLEEKAGELVGSFEYNTDLFLPETMQHLMNSYTHLLQSMVHHPEASIWSLPMVSEQAWQHIQTWNPLIAEPIQPHPLFLDRFEEQVQRTPDAIAIRWHEQTRSYAQLNQQATQLAHWLRAQGVDHEQIVGVLQHRSPDLLVILLAILKAGGAYLPLDPRAPAERLRWMLTTSRPRLVLADHTLKDHLPTEEAQVMCMEDIQRELLSLPSNTCIPTTIEPEQLAYVIYTSGSTGYPKGVAITHRSLAAFLAWATSSFSQQDLDGMVASTSICFDLSVFELFAPLVAGGHILLVEDALMLASAPARASARFLNTVPSVARELVRNQLLAEGIHTIALAGEPLERDLIQHLAALPGVHHIYNLYGPTEDTTYSTCCEVDPNATDKVSIGYPIAHSEGYVLDQHMHPVPVGAVGELYLGGAGLARGYLNQPDLTADRFVPHPFRHHGARLYRTGDLVRYRHDGAWDYLGRADTQVKVHGFRIELEEIEHILGRSPAVLQAAVLVWEPTPGEKELAAYLVLQPDASEGVAQIRAWAQHHLPDYMIPTSWMVLESMPLTTNGKLNRRALPTPTRGRQAIATTYQPAGTDLEQTLSDIWRGLLQVPQVGIHDSFFALGGHSLLAVQVQARLRSVLDIELPLVELFEHPTIAALASWVENARGHKATKIAKDTLPLIPISRNQTLPLSFSQQRLWFLNRLEPNAASYNVPLALRLQGNLDVEACRRSIYQIMQRHETLRTTIVTVAGQPSLRIAERPQMLFRTIDLQHLPQEQRLQSAKKAIAVEVDKPFDLEKSPLVRILLFKLRDAEHVLLINMHHIITDGWSFNIFMNELATLYNGYKAGLSTNLHDLTVQYADYAHWQHQRLQQGLFEKQLAYWKQQLDGLAQLELPTINEQTKPQQSLLAVQPVTFTQFQSEMISQLSRNEGTTPFMTLLTIFQILLHTWSQQEDIVIGTLVANRTRVEAEALIGCFVNTVVLRTQVDSNATFQHLLHNVRETTLAAYSNQETPFELVTNAVQLPRQTGQKSLFRTMFALHNMPDSMSQFSDLTLTQIDMRSKQARIDLMLSLIGEGGTIRGGIEYNSDLFAEETIAMMSQQYIQLTENAMQNPSIAIENLIRSLQIPSTNIPVDEDKTIPSYD